ncbi:GtrA family protein [candidate division KSB1 bacterium]|nr:GtrA family protein [candidate division KSB1 bacterium]
MYIPGLIDSVAALIKKLHSRNLLLFQLVAFTLVGGTGFIIDTMVFSVLIHYFNFGTHWYLVAQSLSFICAVSNNFYLNKWITFQAKGDSRRQYAKFVIISVTAYLIRSALIFFLVDALQVYEMYALIASIVIVSVINFLGSKFWAFK